MIQYPNLSVPRSSVTIFSHELFPVSSKNLVSTLAFLYWISFDFFLFVCEFIFLPSLPLPPLSVPPPSVCLFLSSFLAVFSFVFSFLTSHLTLWLLPFLSIPFILSLLSQPLLSSFISFPLLPSLLVCSLPFDPLSHRTSTLFPTLFDTIPFYRSESWSLPFTFLRTVTCSSSFLSS